MESHFPCGDDCWLCEDGQPICWDCQTPWPCPEATCGGGHVEACPCPVGKADPS